ncbi:MAG: hypothetical protein U9N35_03135 [Euryarchaeota archaeon]|nr:hypothetical protein [Euryarchaeota archaeon]
MKLDFVTVGNIYRESSYGTEGSKITDLKEKLTGDCLDIAVKGASSNAKTGILASVGQDAYGITTLLKKHGVDYTGLILSNEKTGRIIHLDKKYVYNGANRLLRLNPSILQKTRLIHVSDNLEIAGKLMKIDKCFLSTSLDTEADLLFSEEEGPGNRIVFGKNVKFGEMVFDVEIEKKDRTSFIAGFLAKYSKTQKFKSSIKSGISAVKACKDKLEIP